VFVQREAIELDVQPTTSVSELAEQILARFKAPSGHANPSEAFNRVRVIHRGRVLPDDKTLQQCNLLLDADEDATDSPSLRTVILHAALSVAPVSRVAAATSRAAAAVVPASSRRDRPSFAAVLVNADSRPLLGSAASAASAATLPPTSTSSSSSSTSSTSSSSSSSSTSSTSSGLSAPFASSSLVDSGADVDLERGDFFDHRRRQAPADDEILVRRRVSSSASAAPAAALRRGGRPDADSSGDEAAPPTAADEGAVRAPSALEAGGAADHDSDEDRETGGFDVLRSFGFSAADVAAVRRDFHRVRPPTRAAMFRAEEQWLNEESRRDDAEVHRGLAEDAERAVRDGADHDFVIGLVIGFAFSVMSVAFLSQKFVTRRAQMGIYIGIVTNFMLGLSKWFIGFP
jgi:hypothetical protein